MKLTDYTPEIVFGKFFSAWAPFFVVLALVASNVFLSVHISKIRKTRWTYEDHVQWAQMLQDLNPSLVVPPSGK